MTLNDLHSAVRSLVETGRETLAEVRSNGARLHRLEVLAQANKSKVFGLGEMLVEWRNRQQEQLDEALGRIVRLESRCDHCDAPLRVGSGNGGGASG